MEVSMLTAGELVPSSDDPVAVRMVSSDESAVGGRRQSGVVFTGARRSSYVSGGGGGLMSLVGLFAGAAVTTVVSLAAFVAVYVYIEAVRLSTQHSSTVYLCLCTCAILDQK